MHLRDSDICVRYGGEEFLAVLPNCDEGGAYRTAERLRIAIEEHEWSVYADGLSVTASLGVSEFHSKEPTKDWIRRANQAMTKAKELGRNQTLRASEHCESLPANEDSDDDDDFLID